MTVDNAFIVLANVWNFFETLSLAKKWNCDALHISDLDISKKEITFEVCFSAKSP